MADPTTAVRQGETQDVYGHVGRELRQLRVSNGLTQAQAARIIDVSPQQYQKYEEAHSKCSLNYLIALADHYDVEVSVFLPQSATQQAEEALSNPRKMATEADLLARLVSAFVQLSDPTEKLRLVQLVEAIGAGQAKRNDGGNP